MIRLGSVPAVGFGDSIAQRLAGDTEVVNLASTAGTAALFLGGQPTVGFGTIDLLPGGAVARLLAYYKMWTPYVAGVVHAMRAQGDAWAAMATGQTPVAVPNAVAAQKGLNPSVDQSQWQTLAQFCYSQADYLTASWNQHAGSSDWNKVQFASEFLQDYASVIKEAGNLAALNKPVWPTGALPAPADPTQNKAAEPGGWPSPPDPSVQVDVIAHIQALGVLANGSLEALQTGAGGVLQTTADLTKAVAERTGELAGTAADSATTILKVLPWALLVVAVGGTIYFITRITPDAPASSVPASKRT